LGWTPSHETDRLRLAQEQYGEDDDDDRDESHDLASQLVCEVPAVGSMMPMSKGDAQSKAHQISQRKVQALALAGRTGAASVVIDPRTSRHMPYWDSLTALALLYTAVFTPVEVALYQSPTTPDALFWVNRVIDLIFLIDIAVQCLVAYERDAQSGTWEVRLPVIARQLVPGCLARLPARPLARSLPRSLARLPTANRRRSSLVAALVAARSSLLARRCAGPAGCRTGENLLFGRSADRAGLDRGRPSVDVG